jgi:hypothetical protein
MIKLGKVPSMSQSGMSAEDEISNVASHARSGLHSSTRTHRSCYVFVNFVGYSVHRPALVAADQEPVVGDGGAFRRYSCSIRPARYRVPSTAGPEMRLRNRITMGATSKRPRIGCGRVHPALSCRDPVTTSSMQVIATARGGPLLITHSRSCSRHTSSKSNS